MAHTGGAAKPAGALAVEKNAPHERGDGAVRLLPARIRASLDADGLRVVLIAAAEYRGVAPDGTPVTRTSTATYEVPLTGVDTDLRRILRSLLDGHEQTAVDLVTEQTYEARAGARRRGEIV